MSDKRNKFYRPPVVVRIIVYVVTVVATVLAMISLNMQETDTGLPKWAYVAYVFAMIGLIYSIILLVKNLPGTIQKTKDWLRSHPFTGRFMDDFGFRKIIFAIGSFLMSIGYGFINGYTWLKSGSLWHGALAIYYVLLAMTRGGILVHHKRKIGIDPDELSVEIKEATTCRNSGIVLLVLNSALFVVVLLMTFAGNSFHYEGTLIYAYAAYTVYKLTMAIVNLPKSKRQGDMTVEAMQAASLTDALVSLIALQTALLAQFSTDDGVNQSLYNGITGTIVCLGVLTIGIVIIVRGQKRRNTLLKSVHVVSEQGKVQNG
ncbi:MAG: hypothetical protein ACI4MI_02495 [Christensenellales bacterium]